MDIENFREYCLSLPHVEECFPFDDVTLVFKVGGKMFALSGSDDYPSGICLKCTPDKAIELRDSYPDDILPGYHMNKKHWNTVLPLGNLPEKFIKNLIKDSYDLVVAGLPKKVREKLNISL
ncbi:MAG: MmcQ/YjbR family DNA-binding protein [Rikenellaceae bacterium]|nr:MmcQ/YjbR family DNA-binding protein [Rikenellaceae bacterium]